MTIVLQVNHYPTVQSSLCSQSGVYSNYSFTILVFADLSNYLKGIVEALCQFGATWYQVLKRKQVLNFTLGIFVNSPHYTNNSFNYFCS